MSPDQVVARARACVGVRFRPQGRDPAYGLDCLGLVAVAFGARDVPADYTLRGGHRARLEAGLVEHGFRSKLVLELGDIIMFDIGGMQSHLGIWTGSSLIHADAGLRRVVERPGDVAWPVLQAWGFVVSSSLASLTPLRPPVAPAAPQPLRGRHDPPDHASPCSPPPRASSGRN